MVSARFRADETSAKLTWLGLTAGMRPHKPAAAVRPTARSGVRVAAGHIIQDRSVLGKQDCCDLPARPSFALPRLHHCYTVRDCGRSAKPARSLLTELFRPYTATAR